MIVPADIERLLVIAPTWIGDTIMASGLFRAARTACPSAEITLAARPNIVPLAKGSPWFDRVEACDPRGLLGPFRSGRSLRQHRPGAAIVLPGSFRSALMARSSKASIRIGTARDSRRLLLTHALPHPDRSEPRSAVDHYMAIAAAAFGDAAMDPSLELVVTPEDEAEADRLLAGETAPLLLVVPGANRADKRWPAERFARVADDLSSRHGLKSVVAGAPGERDLVREVIAAMSGEAINAAGGDMGLGGLKAIASRSVLAITNDTGPRHIAAAMQTPVVSLFGPTDHRWTLLPGVREARLLADPFLPDDAMADRNPDRCRIDRITVEDVLAAAESLLSAGID